MPLLYNTERMRGRRLSVVTLTTLVILLLALIPNTIASCFTEAELEALDIHPPQRDPGATFTLDENDWTSHHLTTEVMRIVLREAMGYTVHTNLFAGDNGIFERAATGVIDANVEVWTASYPDEYKRFVQLRRTATDAGASGVAGGAGWYVNSPALTGALRPRLYDYWRGLQQASALADFPLYPTIATSWYVAPPYVPAHCVGVSCIEMIADNPAYDTGVLEQQITHLQLPVVLVYVGTEATTTLVQNSTQAGRAVLFYSWIPTYLIASGGYQRVELPNYSAEQYAHGSIACDFAPQRLIKVLRTSVFDDYLRIDAANAVRSMTLGTSQVEAMLAAYGSAASGQETYHSVACAWLHANNETWRSWVYNHGVVDQRADAKIGESIRALGVLAVALNIAYLVIFTWKRDHAVVRASSYRVMMVIGAACLVGTSSVFPITLSPSEQRCNTQSAVFSVSLVVALATLIGKAWRVTRIFLDPRLGRDRVKVSDWAVIRLSLLTGGVQAILHIVDAASGDGSSVRQGIDLGAAVLGTGPVLVTRSCRDFHNAWGVVSVLFKLAVMVAGVFVSFASRQLPAGFSEAKSVALTLYNVFAASVVALPLLELLPGVNMNQAVRGIYVLWTTSITAAMVFVPRAWYIFYGVPDGYLSTNLSGGTAGTRGFAAGAMQSGASFATERWNDDGILGARPARTQSSIGITKTSTGSSHSTESTAPSSPARVVRLPSGLSGAGAGAGAGASAGANSGSTPASAIVSQTSSVRSISYALPPLVKKGPQVLSGVSTAGATSTSVSLPPTAGTTSSRPVLVNTLSER